VLLQGPPGTGKTLTTAVLATCFAAENMSSGALRWEIPTAERNLWILPGDYHVFWEFVTEMIDFMVI
jgi:adenylate kinase family enzyme